MNNGRLFALACASLTLALSASAGAITPKTTLTAFADEQELRAFLDEARRRSQARSRRSEVMQNFAAPASAPAPLAKAAGLADGAAAESVTNTQVAGVDEGGIVKLHGRHLVILRRGKLFTVDVGDRRLAPVDAIDAFAPDVDPAGAWYDEMLISGDTVVIIGYSYARGGTEIGLFNVDGQGRLAYRATYHLRSNDYYSSRNYASRLIGSKLVFYTPLHLNLGGADPYASFPALRRWRYGATPAEFKRIAPATRIYRTDDPIEDSGPAALHTVTTCDLARAEMSCEASAVLGPAGRVFHVSAQSVYVWTNPSHRRQGPTDTRSAVFRIPLEGGAPTAVKAAGSPIDQFSFLESEDGHLNVLVRAHGRGDGMWAAESGPGDLALLRLSLDRFSDGKDSAPASSYRPLPRTAGTAIQNRFVGPWLLYGSGAGWGRPPAVRDQGAFAVRWNARTPVQTLTLPHGVDRIEALGGDAVVVGTSGLDLHFSTVRLGQQASLAGRYTRSNAAQGETRSHGFFYKAERRDEGILGLPIRGGGQPGHRQLRESSASLLYLRNDALKLTEIGELDARAGSVQDGCRASCVDWYGNSRPLFVRDRVFALMGYELVEGRFAGPKIVEAQRIDYAPPRRAWYER